MRFTTAGTESAGYKRLIRIHLAGKVRVRGDLPTGKINRLETGLDLLHGLIAGQRAECIDEILAVQRAPQLFRAQASERMFDRDCATQTHDILGRVVALDAGPARVVGPVELDLFGGGQGGFHVRFLDAGR